MMRTREGMKVVRAKGRLRGKQPKLKPNQAKHLLELHDLGTYTQAELADLSGVGQSTIYRPIERMRPNRSNPSDPSPRSPCPRSPTPKPALCRTSAPRYLPLQLLLVARRRMVRGRPASSKDVGLLACSDGHTHGVLSPPDLNLRPQVLEPLVRLQGPRPTPVTTSRPSFSREDGIGVLDPSLSVSHGDQ